MQFHCFGFWAQDGLPKQPFRLTAENFADPGGTLPERKERSDVLWRGPTVANSAHYADLHFCMLLGSVSCAATLAWTTIWASDSGGCDGNAPRRPRAWHAAQYWEGKNRSFVECHWQRLTTAQACGNGRDVILKRRQLQYRYRYIYTDIYIYMYRYLNIYVQICIYIHIKIDR